MPDITMCVGGSCPFKKSCRRFLAEPNSYQSYFVAPPFKDGGCEYYWEEPK